MNQISALISVSLLLYLVFVSYNRYRLDKFRQDLFAIRDEFFDAAAAERISFESESYKATRTLMNGLLQFGHEISWLDFFLTRTLDGRANLEQAGVHFEKLFEGVLPTERALCDEYLKRVHERTIGYMFSSPLALATMIVPALAVLAMMKGTNLARQAAAKLQGLLREFDERAFQRGQGQEAMTVSRFC